MKAGWWKLFFDVFDFLCEFEFQQLLVDRGIEAWDFRTAAKKSQASNSSKPAVLVQGTSWLQSNFSKYHTHASFLSFTCPTHKARRACKSEAKIMQREHPNCTIFRIFFSLARGGWQSCDFVAPQAGSTALGIHGADSNALKTAF